MAVYAVGDIQGCHDELQHALDQVGFEPGGDTLWCVGDLVNRGPKSLEVLRFFRDLGESGVCVLGKGNAVKLESAKPAPVELEQPEG